MSTFKIFFLYLYALWKFRKVVAAILIFDAVMILIRFITGLAGKEFNF